MNKEFLISLGGKERTLLFGKLGFYQYISDVTKSDPIEWFNQISGENRGVINNIQDVATIVYAGLNTYNDDHDLPEIPFEKAKKWTNGLEISQMASLVTFAFNAFSVESEKKETAPQENA